MSETLVALGVGYDFGEFFSASWELEEVTGLNWDRATQETVLLTGKDAIQLWRQGIEALRAGTLPDWLTEIDQG